MSNYPDGAILQDLGILDRHFPECEDQDEGKMCLCDEILARQEAILAYNQEVNEVILEGIKI